MTRTLAIVSRMADERPQTVMAALLAVVTICAMIAAVGAVALVVR
jgi:hypothetical protein